jgi:hypothetical protein
MRTGRHCAFDEWNTSGPLSVRQPPGVWLCSRVAKQREDTKTAIAGRGRCPAVSDLADRRYANVAPRKRGETPVKALLVIVGWCLLLVLCWPLAVLAVVLWPLVWLLSLPFRVIGITFDALFALLRTILFLPARLLGYRGNSTGRLS